VEAAGGGYDLHPELVALIETHEATLAAIEARTLQADVRLKSEIISRALDGALTASGVAPEMRKAVGALLQADLAFEVVDEPQGQQAYAISAYGPISVANAVSSWLETDDGEAYRLKSVKAAPGRYHEMMRGLRTVH